LRWKPSWRRPRGLGFRKQMTAPAEVSSGIAHRPAKSPAGSSSLPADEPTTGCRLEARNWLEDYLHNYPHAFVLISHDRFFLDATVDQIAEIWNKHIISTVAIMPSILTRRRNASNNSPQPRRISATASNNSKSSSTAFATSDKAKQVQSRIKELEKIERIELPPEEKPSTSPSRSPNPAQECGGTGGCKQSYGPKEVLLGVDLVIERGDRVALVGVTGRANLP